MTLLSLSAPAVAPPPGYCFRALVRTTTEPVPIETVMRYEEQSIERVQMPGTSATSVAVAIATPKQAYEISGPLDPAKFYPRSGLLPAVVAVHDQSGTWDTVGRTRKLMLSDGGHVIETITDTDSPTYFAYELSDFQKLFGSLVSGARAEWRFERVETGTQISWTYTFFGKPGRNWIAALIVRLLWAPYMKRVLPPIAREVSRQATGTTA